MSMAELEVAQHRLATASPPPWAPVPDAPLVSGGCFVCFPRGSSDPGAAGDDAWAGAAAVADAIVAATALVHGTAGAAYEAAFLALREGPLLARAVRAMSVDVEVLLVNATGRDHPRRAGLALHLGARLGIPTVGVTHQTLLATGDEPADTAGAAAPLLLDGETVGAWLRTRAGARPLAVHAAWRTTPGVAVDVVRRCTSGVRTPTALRVARMLARRARAAGNP